MKRALTLVSAVVHAFAAISSRKSSNRARCVPFNPTSAHHPDAEKHHLLDAVVSARCAMQALTAALEKDRKDREAYS